MFKKHQKLFLVLILLSIAFCAKITQASVVLDTDFTENSGGAGLNNTVSSLVIQSDDKIVMVGGFTTQSGVSANRIARFNADGTSDTTFSTNIGTGLSGTVRSLAIQSDGKIVAGGDFTTQNGTTANRIARFNADGTPDTTFRTNIGTGLGSTVNSFAIQPDDKIVVGGNFTTQNGTTANYIARFNADGTPDITFSTNIGIGLGYRTYSLAIQSDGKILAGGDFTTQNGTTANRIARFNSDGTPDTIFSTNIGTGLGATVYSLAIQSMVR